MPTNKPKSRQNPYPTFTWARIIEELVNTYDLNANVPRWRKRCATVPGFALAIVVNTHLRFLDADDAADDGAKDPQVFQQAWRAYDRGYEYTKEARRYFPNLPPTPPVVSRSESARLALLSLQEWCDRAGRSRVRMTPDGIADRRLRIIVDAVHDLAGSSRAIGTTEATKRRAHRPPAHDPNKDAAFVRDWHASGRKLAEFAQSRGVPMIEAGRTRDRVRDRQRAGNRAAERKRSRTR